MGSTENPNYWYDDKKRLIKSNNDPDIWIEFYPSDVRAEFPPRYVIHIDGRKIGFTFAVRQIGGIRPMDKETGLPSYVFGPFGLHIIAYTEAEDITLGGTYLVKTNAKKFESREQQDRAIKFILEGFSVFTGANTPSELKEGKIGAVAGFSPEVIEKIAAGDFIELAVTPFRTPMMSLRNFRI